MQQFLLRPHEFLLRFLKPLRRSSPSQTTPALALPRANEKPRKRKQGLASLHVWGDLGRGFCFAARRAVIRWPGVCMAPAVRLRAL
jgi:hypothetical protein